MGDENWQQVKYIFNAAVQLEPSAREQFVRAQCGGDEALFREVDSDRKSVV